MTEATEAQAENGADKTATVESKNSYDGAAMRSERKEEPKEETAEKRAGYNPVDIDKASPEEIKERINYLYRQVKDGNKAKGQYIKIAEEQSRQIEELTKGFNGVVSHLTTKNFADSEEAITAQLDAAFAKGDNKGYLEAQKKLINLGVEKRIAAEQAKQQPKQVQQQTQQGRAYDSASQIARDAEASGELSAEETNYTAAWQNEKDENGELLRPWSKTADMYNPDPEFRAALNEANGVFNNPRFANKSIEEKLAEVDRRMGVAKRTVSQTVSGIGLTGKSKSSKVSLSADIEKMVKVTKWGGSKFKTDEERLAGYRAQLQKVKGGTR